MVEQYQKYKCKETLAFDLLHHDDIIASDLQKKNPKKFKASLCNLARNHAKLMVGAVEDVVTVDVVLEVLDLLKTPPTERTSEAPVGASCASYFDSAAWKKYLWKSLWVHSHDYDYTTGKFTSIIVFPLDVLDRAKAFAEAFPNVQLEIDYFFLKRFFASWVVGHVGSSCFLRSYWLFALQIAIYENEKKATKLLEASVEVIHKNTRGRVTTVLSDGGTALAAAVRRIGEQDAGYGRYAIGLYALVCDLQRRSACCSLAELTHICA